MFLLLWTINNVLGVGSFFVGLKGIFQETKNIVGSQPYFYHRELFSDKTFSFDQIKRKPDLQKYLEDFAKQIKSFETTSITGKKSLEYDVIKQSLKDLGARALRSPLIFLHFASLPLEKNFASLKTILAVISANFANRLELNFLKLESFDDLKDPVTRATFFQQLKALSSEEFLKIFTIFNQQQLTTKSLHDQVKDGLSDLEHIADGYFYRQTIALANSDNQSLNVLGTFLRDFKENIWDISSQAANLAPDMGTRFCNFCEKIYGKNLGGNTTNSYVNILLQGLNKLEDNPLIFRPNLTFFFKGFLTRMQPDQQEETTGTNVKVALVFLKHNEYTDFAVFKEKFPGITDKRYKNITEQELENLHHFYLLGDTACLTIYNQFKQRSKEDQEAFLVQTSFAIANCFDTVLSGSALADINFGVGTNKTNKDLFSDFLQGVLDNKKAYSKNLKFSSGLAYKIGALAKDFGDLQEANKAGTLSKQGLLLAFIKRNELLLFNVFDEIINKTVTSPADAEFLKDLLAFSLRNTLEKLKLNGQVGENRSVFGRIFSITVALVTGTGLIFSLFWAEWKTSGVNIKNKYKIRKAPKKSHF